MKSFEKKGSFIKDHEEKVFFEEQEFDKFLKEREENDIWLKIKPDSFEAMGVPDCPIAAIMGGNNALPEPIPNYVGDNEGLADAMREYGLVGSFFDIDDQREYALPLRFTSIDSLFQQAGVSGEAFRENNDGGISSKERAEFITKALHRGNRKARGEVTVLIRDMKISTVRSKKYVPLLTSSLLKILEENLSDPYFRSGSITHAATEVLLGYGTEYEDDDIISILNSKGIQVGEIERSLRFITSDVGNNAATANPYIKIDGIEIPMGEGLKLEHSTGATLGKWHDMCGRISAILDEMPRNIERLATIKLDHPDGLLAWMLNRSGLCHGFVPKKQAQAAIDEVTGKIGLTALDMYKKCAELISANIKQDTTLSKKVAAFEGLARCLKENIAAADYRQQLA